MKDKNVSISPRAMYALHILKSKLTADNDLALKATNTGSMVIAHHIDEIVAGIMKLETELLDCRLHLDILREEVKGYRELLDDYTAEMLSDDEKAELRALVEKWREKDKEDD